ncbi:MAG: PriCT-2 domain-containing protein [Candidatus Cloacimonadaceae bacterium]|nr:PriCT-2 domain-containing protein [Candidatus Cloacimonadaceae bacterium]
MNHPTSDQARQNQAANTELNNSAIRYPVSVGTRVSFPKLIAVRDISHVMNGIKTGIIDGRDIRCQIALIRSAIDADLARNLKTELPYFTGSLCDKLRSNGSVVQAQFIVFDIDHVADIPALKAAAVEKLPFVRWAFRSVRDGVKLIAMLDRPVRVEEEYRLIWQYLAIMTGRALGLEVDRTPDWSRACFFSHDPEIIHNHGYVALSVSAALEQAAFAIKLWESGGTGGRRSAEAGSQAQAGDVATASDCTGGRRSAKAGSQAKDGGVATASDGTGGRRSALSGNVATASDGTLSDGTDYAKAEKLVRALSQVRMQYHDWIKAGMALHSGFGERGKTLWDIFLDNPHYKDDQRKLDTHWRSFRGVGSVGLASLFYLGEKYGVR